MGSTSVLRDERRFLVLLLIAGLAIRLLWLAHAEGPIDASYGSAEASRVAVAVAQGRGIADAFYPGYGPTAHLMPVSPAIAGFLLRLFGIGTPAANLALLGWCLAQVGLGIVLLRALFRSLGADVLVTRWGTALLCLVTPFAIQETVDFRYWEGASALCLAAANLLLIRRFEVRAQPGWSELTAVAALAAITLFVCPPVGLATGACWTVLAARHLDRRRSLRLAFLTGAALLAIFVPWSIRNARSLGEPILLRSNFGLELALANHEGALSDRPPELVFADRLRQLHPYQASATAPLRIRPGGEVAYSRALERQTLRWIVAHPGGFAILYLRHLGEFFFPRPWQMDFSGWSGNAAGRAFVISLVNLLGLLGLGLRLYQRREGYWTPALFLAALSLPYALFQPTARYIYLAYGPLAFLAVDGLIAIAPALKRRIRLLSEMPRRHVEQP